MYPIAVCSFALLVFVFERFIALRRGRVIPRPFVQRFLEQLREGQLDREKALKLCQENNSPIAPGVCRRGEEVGPDVGRGRAGDSRFRRARQQSASPLPAADERHFAGTRRCWACSAPCSA